MARLRLISLHANLRVTRVQVSFADLLRDRFHAVFADLTHSTHLCTVVKGTCLRNCSHILLLTLDWLRLRALIWHISTRILCNSVSLRKTSVLLILWQVIVETLEAVIGAHQVRDGHPHV